MAGFDLPGDTSMASGLSEVIPRRTLMAQTQQQMTLAALGIQRYTLATGSVPKALSDLVPKYLSTVPHDHMGGGELRYRAESASSYLLYSVGLNGQDDGGDASPLSPDTLLLTLNEGKDFVWPKAASLKETEAYLLENRF